MRLRCERGQDRTGQGRTVQGMRDGAGEEGRKRRQREGRFTRIESEARRAELNSPPQLDLALVDPILVHQDDRHVGRGKNGRHEICDCLEEQPIALDALEREPLLKETTERWVSAKRR